MTAKEYLQRTQLQGDQVGADFKRMERMQRELQRGRQELSEKEWRRNHRELYRLQSDLRRGVDKLLQNQREAAVIIGLVQDETSRNILSLRYLFGLRWVQISRKMHYSSRHLHRLHKRALEELEDNLPKGM